MKNKHIQSIVRKNLTEADVPNVDDVMDYVKSKVTNVSGDIYKKIKGMDPEEAMNSFKNAAKNARTGFKDFLNKIKKGEYEFSKANTATKSASTSVSKMLGKSKYGATLLQDAEFITKLDQVASNLGVESVDLLKVMKKETGGTFNPKAVNPKSKATGLIQFMPQTARRLGTTVEAIRDMSPTEQLEYVEKYYRPYKNKINGYEDLYLVTFFPAAVGKPDDWVFRTKKTSAELISRQNPAIARAAGKQPGEPLTVADFKRYAGS